MTPVKYRLGWLDRSGRLTEQIMSFYSYLNEK